jgi:hypothetical protein
MSSTSIFDILRAEAKESGETSTLLTRSSRHEVGCRTLCAISCNDLRASVIIELDNEGQAPKKLPQLKGFMAELRKTKSRPCVVFEVADLPPSKTAGLAEHILLLVAAQTPSGLDGEKTVGHFVDGMNRLHKVLSRSSELLGPEARLGLFGELNVLKELLIPAVGPEKAVRYWTGPHAQPQDFMGEVCAFEVKTTRGAMPQRLKISSERQLDTRTIDRLYLVVLTVEEKPAQGMTLPQAVDALRQALASYPAASAAFDEALLLVGFRDEHAPNYIGELYVLRDSAYFHVREGFPRITESMIPPGLGKVHYEIEVGACEPFKVEEAPVREYLSSEG